MAKSKKSPPRDFEKKVVKVGKIKKGPANKTDTSFTARKIIVRAQNFQDSSTTTTATAASSSATETVVLDRIKGHLGNCGHYNVSMRKEAVNNILKCTQELKDLNSPEFLGRLDSIFAATFRLLCDDDANVRQAFYSLLNSIFAGLKDEKLAAFFPRWMSFVNLAITHIKPEIRKDSLKFIQLTLKSHKSLLTPHLSSLLPALLPLVNQFPAKMSAVMPAFDCYMAVLDAYLEPFLEAENRQSDALNKPLFEFSWHGASAVQSLEIIRTSPFDFIDGSTCKNLNSRPALLSESQVRQVISHLSNLSISQWIDHSHLLSESFSSSPQERKQLQLLLNFYRRLLQLCQICCDDRGEDGLVFWQAMPARIVKTHQLALKERLEK